MNINNLGNISSSLSSASTGDAVAVSVLKKSLDIQAQAAMQLIEALPQQPASTAPVGSLGHKVNTFA